MHLPPLIQDLSLILSSATLVSILFRYLKLPVILGYLMAGILIGPQVTLVPTIVDIENVKVWADLGVVFLLFVLGIEFSFRKLLRVGRSAIITASIEVILMIGLGYLTGLVLGWTKTEALFLGAILGISSTSVIIKVFQEQGIKTQTFAALVFGILIIEDLIAVFLLAFLGTMRSDIPFSWAVISQQLLFIVLFLACLIPAGLWVIPRFFKFIRPFIDDELRVILSLALCLALVVLSVSFGSSGALGAFLMGAFLGETLEGERMERFLKPIRDLFGAIFFTSVGILVDIHEIPKNLVVILILSAVTMLGKFAFTYLGARMAREDSKTAIQTGLCLGQIGEFSFIIAHLGMSMSIIRNDMYSLAVSVALVTTFFASHRIQWASRIQRVVQLKNRHMKKQHPKLWDGHVVEFEIHPHFQFSGKSLEELKLREKFGISIVRIIRGDRNIIAPNRYDQIMPYDRVLALGTDLQLSKLEKFFQTERHESNHEVDVDFDFGMFNVLVNRDHAILGKSLRESGLRERVNGIVLGIERSGDRILNPDSTTILERNDKLWIYGHHEQVRELQRELEDTSS